MMTEKISSEEDLNELRDIDGLNIRHEAPETIEKHALETLRLLSSGDNPEIEEVLEDGEVSDEAQDPSSSAKNVLSMERYFENQINLNRQKVSLKHSKNSTSEEPEKTKLVKRKATRSSSPSSGCSDGSDYDNEKNVKKKKDLNSDSDYIPSDDEDFDPKPIEKVIRITKKTSKFSTKSLPDDGNISLYKKRLVEIPETVHDEDKKISNNIFIPRHLWNKLYRYQKVGVKWMCELNEQKVGGLLGDDMGLGKTVQVIAFLAALDYSKQFSKFGRFSGLGPSLIVAPATVLHQWVRHFHEWYPTFRVAILHQSGSFGGRNKNDLIREINQTKGILVTTYQGILSHEKLLSELTWHYLVLDEGHKIRNPSAKVSIAVKKFKTPHRLVLTGSPMQNNLTELWSLFDFIVPGKLGSLQAFLDHFATPIIQGGYVNATPMQEATALSIATALKNMITPYMLRRAKVEVNDSINLPNKNEQILFCELTKQQLDMYKSFLLDDTVNSILDRGLYSRLSKNQLRAKVLTAVMSLRKICNHPDIHLMDMAHRYQEGDEEPVIEFPEHKPYGYFRRSGKMRVVAALLRIWKRQNHRALLFTQTKSMIDIFERFLNGNEYRFLKMDGGTSVGSRQTLIDEFNNNTEIFVFLLTTRVGGLGVNLTGADRVIIFDPDWNPATDSQARERAWRIGQDKQVTIYRLLSSGTIEEKMYQRQVFKQLLSDKVLTDPRQQKFFRNSDLQDLFSLQITPKDGTTETGNIFKNSQVSISDKKSLFSEEKVKAMKSLAAKIAQQIKPNHTESQNVATTSTSTNNEEKTATDDLDDANFYKRYTYIFDPTTIRFKNPRKIIVPLEEPEKNFTDGHETNSSFCNVLENLNESKPKQISPNKTEIKTPVESTKKKRNKQKKERDKIKFKYTNIVDGEEVESLVKKEKIKKPKKRDIQEMNLDENQDEYVLKHLLTKGVQNALAHESVVQSAYSGQSSAKVKFDAEKRAQAALNALRSSREKKLW